MLAATDIVKQARKRLGWEWELTTKDVAFIQRLMNYSYDLGYIKKKLKADDIVDFRNWRNYCRLDSGGLHRAAYRDKSARKILS